VLLLFDIDGTLLLDAADAHAAALMNAMERVYRVEVVKQRLEVAGYTDPAIARRYLTLAGVDDKRVDDGLEQLRDVAVQEYARLCPEDISDTLNPGIVAVLDELAPAHQFSLVTGNLEPIARLKLKRAGIGHYFDDGQGGFGSDHEDRALLPAIARKRAGDHSREGTVVIGDTPRDIACARADDISVIAISTGPFGAADLEGADVVISRADQIPGAIASL
jgi:phosphoglycolate phosphatase